VPTYSYRCTQCDNAFEIQQAFTDDSLTICSACGGQLRKIFNTISVTFNGSGFYRTDSRAAKDTKKSSPVGETGGSSGSNGAESSSSETSSQSRATDSGSSATGSDAAKSSSA